LFNANFKGYKMNKLSLAIICKFTKLPKTDEKDKIERQYLLDEIGSFEFFQLARAYIDKLKQNG